MFKDLKLRFKILIFPGLFFFVLLIVFIVIQLDRKRNTTQMQIIEKGYVPYVEYCNQLLVVQKEIQRELQDGVASYDEDKINDTKEIAAQFNALTDSAKQTLIGKEKTELDSMKLLFEDYFKLATETSLMMIRSEEFSEEMGANLQLMVSTYNQVKEILERITADSKVAMANAFKKADETSSNSAVLIRIVLVICLIIFIAISYFLTRIIVGSIKGTIDDLTKLSDGKMDFTISKQRLKRADETGDISRAIDHLIIKLKEVLEGVKSGASDIANASEQLSAVSEQVAQGSNAQASSVEEVSATMQQISSNIDQNSHNSEHTSKVALSSADKIKDVGQAVKDSIDSVNSISEKISLITDIAFQINILSLNASVEAARAGEHGKGFAVVAQEVRRLAEHSKFAAQEIVNHASSSLETTKHSGELIFNLLPEIEKTSELIKEITAASLEQKTGVNQVNESVQELNRITQQNAASSEEMSTSATEMAGQAGTLNDLISYFKF